MAFARPEKIKGIKTVDVSFKAHGYGVVNWNGGVRLKNPAYPASPGSKKQPYVAENHTLPKLRGFSPLADGAPVVVKEDGNSYTPLKSPMDIDVKKNPLYISDNCLRHNMFKHNAFDAQHKQLNTVPKLMELIASEIGLLRGYVVPDKQWHRTGAFLIEDFVDTLGNGNFEQFTNAGERDENSLFSKTTFGDTAYTGFASIDIEQLQFIELSDTFGRAAIQCDENEAKQLADMITEFVSTQYEDLNQASATFHPKVVRKGTIFNDQSTSGILLNNDAITVLVRILLEKFESLSIRQAQSWMAVQHITVDYNTSNQPMRIRGTNRTTNDSVVNPSCDEFEFARYYEVL